jgi:hypothetical protein
MQSFLTDPNSFELTAAHLDNKRLHKQTLEAWQCLLTMCELDPEGNDRKPKGWSNHPVVKMWKGHETLLVSYISATYFEWKSRGYKSTLLEKTYRTYDKGVELGRISPELTLPSWMTDSQYYADMCSTHRTALLCKNYEWYRQFGWAEDTGIAPVTYEYLWPHQDGYVQPL